MLNHITIMGRLTKDPELRRTGSGVAVANFTVAVDRDYAPQGQDKETDFIDCVAWRNTGEFVSKYFTKGRVIVVSGRLEMRRFTDKNGNNRTVAEVVADSCYFGDSKKDNGKKDNGNQDNGNQGGYSAPAGGYNMPANNGYGQLNNGFGGYPAPAGDQYGGQFNMLNDEDAGELPF